MKPDFLVIGHVTEDVSHVGRQPGGTATYAALTAARMGLRTAVVTTAPRGATRVLSEAGVAVHVLECSQVTVFHNSYGPRGRLQFLRARAPMLGPAHVPAEWLTVPLALLGPVAAEVEPAIAALFPRSLVGVTPQGWLRRWDEDGRVWPCPWADAATVLKMATVVAVSEDDLPNPGIAREWAALVPVLAVTRGSLGCSIHWRGRWHVVKPFRVTPVDPTGAGDVFAAALLIRYHECGDPVEAARFAACAASFCVEAPGPNGVPTRAMVEARLQQAADEEAR